MSELDNHTNFALWDSEAHQGKVWSIEAIDTLLNEVMTGRELADGLDIPYDSLVKAFRESRIQARQSGSTWLSTIAAVKQAIEAGTIRPRKRLLKSTQSPLRD